MSRQPWFKFFPTDWRADPQLRMCSLAARGLWIEILGIMHEADERGLLTVNGIAVTAKQVAVLVGCSEAEAGHHLNELEQAGVFSRKKNGMIYSRRMERDENLSRKNRENGKKGGLASLGKESENGGSLNRKPKLQKPEARSQIEIGEAVASLGGDAAGAPAKPETDPNGEAQQPDPAAGAPSGAIDPADVHRAFNAFNFTAIRVGLPRAKDLTNDRRKKIAGRLRDGGGLDGWRAALEAIERSPLCRGEKTEWKASLDWLVSPTNFQKLIEGTYDARTKPPQQNGHRPGFAGRLRDAFDARADRSGAAEDRSPDGAGERWEHEVQARRAANDAGAGSLRSLDCDDAELLAAQAWE